MDDVPARYDAAADDYDETRGGDARAAAVAREAAETLESAILRAGGCAAAMRSLEAWQRLDQGRAVRAEPLVALAERPVQHRVPWRPDPADEREFVRRLEAKGISTTVRDTRGREIDGACGQLAAAE